MGDLDHTPHSSLGSASVPRAMEKFHPSRGLPKIMAFQTGKNRHLQAGTYKGYAIQVCL
jgi:hypothetical protein